jgi:hypothetical protein
MDIAKTPLGMFETDYIPNDLKAIDKKIREYEKARKEAINGMDK